MKQRIFSLFTALCLCLSLLPATAFAESTGEPTSGEAPVCTYEEVCTADEMNATCPVCGAEGAQATDCGQFTVAEAQPHEPAEPQTDEAVAAAQALLDALPTLETVSADDYDAVQTAYDAYEALTEEQQALIVGAEVFEALFAWFNEQVTPLEDNTLTVTIQDASGNAKEVTLTADSDGYYQIKDADDLYAFAAAVNTVVEDTTNPEKLVVTYPNTSINGKLMNDITVNSNVLKTDGALNSGTFRQWTPISKSSANYYGGTFDGNGKIISGLYYNYDRNELSFVGLFGYLREATVKDLTVQDSYFYVLDPGLTIGSNFIRDDARLGVIAGYCGGGSQLENITVQNSYLSAKQTELVSAEPGTAGADGPFVGGIAGEIRGSTTTLKTTKVTNVQIFSAAKIAQAGGIAGISREASVEEATVTGTKISSASEGSDMNSAYAGGIIGISLLTNSSSSSSASTVKNSTVKDSTVSGSSRFAYVGGIVGYTTGSTIIGCTSSATITATASDQSSASGTAYAGGVAGKIQAVSKSTTIQACINTGSISATCSDGADRKAYAGGIVANGATASGTSISVANCANTGSVIGSADTQVYLGGIAGDFSGGGSRSITSCYHTGEFTHSTKGNSYLGGIIGILAQGTTVKNCCYRNDRASEPYSSQYATGTAENVIGLDESDFKNGPATWLLNGNSASGAWKQTLNTDALPTLSESSKTLYYGYETCKDTAMTYSNDQRYSDLPHQYGNDGICSVCSQVDPSSRYNVWVCGTQITASNAGNVLINTDNGGKVSYDDSSKTLTLNGADLTYDDSKTLADGSPCVGVIYATQELKVLLRGENTITVGNRVSGTGYDQYGIRVVGGNLTITGKKKASGGYEDHSLTISFADSSGKRGNADGIYVDGGDINIDCGPITINGGDAASSSHGICVKDGNATIKHPANVTALGGAVTNTATSGTDSERQAESCGVLLWNTPEDSTNGKIEVISGAKLTAKAGSTSSTAGAAHSEGIHAETVWINAWDTKVVTNCSDDSTTANGTETRLCGILANQKLYINMATVTASLIVWKDTAVTITGDWTYPTRFLNISLEGGDVATLYDLIGGDLEFRSRSDNAKTDRSATALTNVKVVPHSHTFDSNSACECGYVCDHTGSTSEDTCSICGKQFYVAQIGENKYATFNEAYTAAKDGDTITLLGDAVYQRVNGNSDDNWTKSFTIQLNDHKLSFKAKDGGGATQFIQAAVTIQGPGSLGKVLVWPDANSSLTLKGNVTCDYVIVDGTLIVSDSSVKVKELDVGPAATIALSTGTYDKVTCCDDNGQKKIGDLLADGYAFKTTDGTWYDQYNNSDATTVSNVTVTAAPITKVELTADKESYTFGEDVMLTATVTKADSVTATPTYQWADATEEWENSVTGEKITIVEIGVTEQFTYNVKATVDGYSRVGTVTFPVTKATLAESVGYTKPAANTLTYNGTPQALVSGGRLGLSVIGRDGYPTFKYRLGTDGEWMTDAPTAEGAGTYTVYWYIDGGANYNNVGSETSLAGSVDVTIKPLDVTVTPNADQSKKFGKDDLPLLYTTDLTGSLKEKFDEHLKGSLSRETGENVGQYKITLGTLSGGKNFNVTLSDTPVYFSITKADAPKLTDYTVSQYYGDTTLQTLTIDLTKHGFPVGQTVTAVVADRIDSDATSSGVNISVGDTPTLAGTTMTATYTSYVKNSNEQAVFFYKVSSQNYKDATLKVVVTFVDKVQKPLTVTMTGWTYGETANTPSYTENTGMIGTAKVEYKVKNEADSTYTETVPTNAGDYTVKVAYETATEIWSGTAEFTISRKSLAGADITLDKDTFTYNGESQKPTVTGVSLDGTTLTTADYTVSYDAKTNAGTGYLLTIDGKGNYNGTMRAEWSIAQKEIEFIQIVTNSKKYDGTTTATYYTINVNTGVKTNSLAIGTDITATLNFVDKNVGNDKTVNATVTLSDNEHTKNYYIGENTVITADKASIEAKPVTATVTVDGKTYDGTNAATVTATVNAGDLIEGDSITISGLTGTFDSANVGDDKSVTIDLSGKSITGEGSGNYLVTIPTEGYKANIAPAELTGVSVEQDGTLTYNGNPQTATVNATATAVNGQQVTFTYSATENGTYSNTVPSFTNADTHTVYYKASAENHNDATGSFDVTIAKAPLTVKANDHTITYGDAPANNGVTYSGFVGGDSETKNDLQGTLTYHYNYQQYGEIGNYYIIGVNGSSLTSNNYRVTFESGTLKVLPKEIGITWGDTSLTYTGQPQAPTATATGLMNNDTCTITVTGAETNAGTGYTATATELSNKNYKLPADVTTSFTIAKASQTVTAAATSVSGTYGDTDKSVSASGVGAVRYAVTNGSNVVTVDADGKLTFLKSGTATVTATAAGDSNHESGTVEITVTVAPKVVTVTALDKSAYTYDAAPDLSNLVEGKDYTVTGLVEGDTITVSLSCTPDMTKTGEYAIVPTITGDTSKYEFTAVNGKLNVTTRPVVPSTSTTTVKNPDGSTTTTVTDKKTGTVTETTKNPDGTTGTIVTDKNGNVTDISAKVPASAVKDGESVELPIDAVKPADKGEDATEIRVDVPTGGATVVIPVENPTPSTVIVIVDEDGNETVIPGSKATENGVEITLTGNATIKVIENSKKFSDVPDSAWYADAVAWAAAREITDGIGGDLFGPDMSCTRAQLITFLWRAAGQPEAAGESGMSDVAQGSFYERAVAWAAENGIVGGYGNGQFGSEDTITREQMAVILYRFARFAGMDTAQSGAAAQEFKDFDSVSGFAVDAVRWAVSAGILQGYDGILAPQSPCTRAQIVTMLYRLLGK